MEVLKCLECGTVIRGRIDKKFCNDYCRNSYHNRMKSKMGSTFRKVNKILKKNYLILKDKVPEDSGKKMISREELLTSGFDFIYHTHTYTTKRGAIYYFCYDYGYLKINEEKFVLVKRKDHPT